MFICKKMLIGSENTPPIMFAEADKSAEIKIGQALMLEAGLCKVAAGKKPKYIALNTQQGGVLPVCYVTPFAVFETELSVVGTAFKVGDKLNLSADGMSVADKNATGVATIFKLCGTEVGDKVQVIFE